MVETNISVGNSNYLITVVRFVVNASHLANMKGKCTEEDGNDTIFHHVQIYYFIYIDTVGRVTYSPPQW